MTSQRFSRTFHWVSCAHMVGARCRITIGWFYSLALLQQDTRDNHLPILASAWEPSSLGRLEKQEWLELVLWLALAGAANL